MKKLNKILAMLLCAVMILGITPIAFEDGNEVTAADSQGVVQGANDAVIIMDATGTAALSTTGNPEKNFIKALQGNKIGGVGNSSGTSFDRIIVLFTADFAMKSDFAFGSSVTTGVENIVFTQKATITNKNYVWKCLTKSTFEKTVGFDGLINHYDSSDSSKNVEVTFVPKDLGYMRFECDLCIDYLRLRFPNKNPLIYCTLRDFTVGENVKFEFAGKDISYRPIILNFVNGNYYYESSTTKSIPANSVQTIKLLGGEYQYVSPRSRSYSNTYTDCEINLVLGKAHFVGGPQTQMARGAFIANDNLVRTTINVEIDGAIFENTVWFLGATEFAASEAPKVEGAVINLHIKNGTFRGGIGDTIVPSDTQYKQYDTTGGLAINVTVDSVILGSDTYIRAERIEDEAYITSTLCCDEAFEPTYAGYFLDFDKRYTLDESLSSRVACGSGESTLVYVNTSDPADTKTVKHNCTAHNYAPYYDENFYPYYRCTYCKNDAGLTSDYYECPMLYVTGDNGSIFNSGINEENGVDTIERASELIAEWGMGGTVVNCATLLKPGEEVWKYTHNTLTVTSKDENCKVQFQGFVNFEGDVRFSGLYLAATSEAKTFFLNYNNFTVESNCEQAATTGGYKLAVVAGARANSEASKAKYATNKKEIDQKIDLQSLNWCTVFAGTTSANADKIYYASNKDYSVDCEGYVNINVGGTANVANVDLVTNEGIFAKVVLPIEKEVTIKNNHDTSTAIQFTLADCADGKTTVYGNFTATEGDVTGSEEHVYKYDPNAFTHVGVSVKSGDEDGYYGLRATFGVSKDVDESAVEFGTILYNEWYVNRFRYFRGDTYYGGTGTSDALGTNDKIAKSVAYLKDAEGKAAIANYQLGAEDDEATFRATVEFDDDATIASFKHLPINFMPYKVVNDENGWFTVIGESFGDTLLSLATRIAEDVNATDADKQKAESVIAHVESLSPVE